MTRETSDAATSSAARTPSNQEYLDAANWAYDTYRPGKSKGGPHLPDGMHFLTTGPAHRPLVAYNADAGLYAAALVTAENKVIIVYEGTNFDTGSARFTTGQALDDLAIYTGLPAPSYAPSAAFARTVLADATRNGKYAVNDVFLDGHSLGAAEAEYAGARTGISGVTFGTPGIPTYLSAGTTSHLTNYVEVNDPVANYAANTPYVFTPNVYEPYSPLDPHPSAQNPDPSPIVLSDTIQHYNGQIVLPDPFGDQPGHPSILDAAQADYQKGDLSGAAGYLTLGLGDHLLSSYAYGLGINPPPADLSSGNGPGATSADASWIVAGLTGGGALSAVESSLPIGQGFEHKLAAEARHLGIGRLLRGHG